MTFRTLFLVTISIFQTARAAEVSLTVDSAAAYALRHNPSLAAARHRIEEARGRLEGAGRLSNPEAEFQFSQNPRSPERSFGLAWTQKFPVTDRLRLERAVSRAEVAAAEAEVREAERKLAGEVRLLSVKLLALNRQKTLRGEQITNSEQLSEFLTKRVGSGEAAAVEVSQVQLESRQLATQVLQLGVEQTILLGELRPLLGVKSATGVTVTGTLADPAGLPAKGGAVAERGDYRTAQANAEAARQAVALAKANRWEDVGVGLMAEHSREEDAPDGFERDTLVGFKVSIPLPIWNKNEGKIREATAAAARTQKEVEAVAAQAAAEAAAARGEMAAWAGIIAEIDGQLIPQAKQIEEQLRSSYATGQTPLPEVVRARGRRFELEAQRLDALRDYHLARAKHTTAKGTTPSSPKPKR